MSPLECPPPRSAAPGWLGRALVSSMLVSCAGVIGIEDAICDPTYDVRCSAAGNGAGAAQSVAGQGGAANGGGREPSDEGGGNASGDPEMPLEPLPLEPLPLEPLPLEPLCTRYCRAVLGNCTGDLAVYASVMACETVCALLDPGQPGDDGVNTVECRLARAELARMTGEPADYCFSAGPGGGDACGPDCEGYCDVMTPTCDDLGSREQCLSECATVPVDTPAFSIRQQFGNSIQCRLFHVTAATLDPVVHCEHAAGLAVCVGVPPPL